jgi:hypothetical protein
VFTDALGASMEFGQVVVGGDLAVGADGVVVGCECQAHAGFVHGARGVIGMVGTVRVFNRHLHPRMPLVPTPARSNQASRCVKQ